MKYARVENGVVQEVVDLPEGANPAELFNPTYRYVTCLDTTQIGDTEPPEGWGAATGTAAAPTPARVDIYMNRRP